MRDGERGRDAGAEKDALRLRQAPGQGQSAREGKRVQIHRDEHDAIDLTHIANGHDIPVAEPGCGGCFFPETGLRDVLTRKLRTQDFEGDGNFQILVYRLIYPRKSPRTEQSGDLIFADRLPQIAVRHV